MQTDLKNGNNNKKLNMENKCKKNNRNFKKMENIRFRNKI